MWSVYVAVASAEKDEADVFDIYSNSLACDLLMGFVIIDN